MITKLALTKTNWPIILFGLAAISIGGLVSLLVTHQSNNLLVVVGAGSFILLALVIKPKWGIEAFNYSLKSDWALLFLAFMIYTHLSDILIKVHGLPSIAKPYVGLLLFILIARWFLYKDRPRNWERSLLFLISYGLIIIPSFLYAENPSRVQSALLTFFKDAIIVVIVTMMIQRTTTLHRVIWVLLAAGIFLGTLTTYQQLTGTFENTYWGFSEVRFVARGGTEQRISGPRLGPNVYAQFMLVLVPLALDRLWNERKQILRIFALWALVVCLLTLVFTFSRGAFLALVVTLIIMFVFRPPKPMSLLITILIVAALLQYIPASYSQRLTTLTELVGENDDNIQDQSFRNRLSENRAAWMMFNDYPLLGVGLNNYGNRYQEYSRQIGFDRRREYRSPHSMYLEYASQLGLVGLIWLATFVGILFFSLRQARANFLAAGMPDYAGMVVAFGVGLISFFITSIFLHVSYPRYVWLLYGIALAIPYVANQALKQSTTLVQSE